MGRTEGNGQISIHALREEGDRLQRIQRHRRFSISIHALREEGDFFLLFAHKLFNDFYPRPPRGGRLRTMTLGLRLQKFLSTPSARRATEALRHQSHLVKISIHALREEGDRHGNGSHSAAGGFLSTPSARRATRKGLYKGGAKIFLSTPSARRATHGHAAATRHLDISIHALREEGDAKGLSFHRTGVHFYPRPPRGGRQAGCPIGRTASRFLSTPSARRATASLPVAGLPLC